VIGVYREAMTITLSPQAEGRLRAIAQTQNLSIEEVVERLVEREREHAPAIEQASQPRARTLVELFADSPLKGSGVVIERDRSLVRDTVL
jgi:fructose-1,6-bisphosphatase/sedoheptulose 1,7-bisphosphatase-like protein